MHKIKSLMTPTTFQNKFRKPTLRILQISLYPTTVYRHLNQVSRNVEFQSKAPHFGRTFLQTLRKCKKV